MKVTPLSTARRSSAIASPSSRGGPQTPAPVMRIAPNPSRPTVVLSPNVSVPGLATGVVWSDMMRVSPRLPGGRLVIGRRMAIVRRHIAGWVGRGRCGTGRRTNSDTRCNANANARGDDSGAAIHRATAIDGTADDGAAIGTASGSAAIGTADGGRAGRGADGSPAHRAAIGGPAAGSRH